MLARFLELSVQTPDIRASVEFYAGLGFAHADVGEAWSHPYAVMTDGRLCVGLHQQEEFQSSLTFVKPNLSKHVAELDRRGLSLEFCRLGDGVFNELGWFDPSGHLIRLLEARTFSPGEDRANGKTSCGYFLEIALPASAPDLAKSHWETLGFVGMEDFDAVMPHIACISDTVEIGLYSPAYLTAPTLMFEVDRLEDTLMSLAARGLNRRGRLPGSMHGRAAMLTAPEGTPILLVAARGA